MALYRQKYNPLAWLGFSLVPTANVITFKAGVANQAALPLSGNTQNDARIANDTGLLYVWSIPASSGLLTDWISQGDILTYTWDGLEGKPSSSPTNIDDSVSKRHNQGTDQGLDTGGLNATTAAQVKQAVTDDHNASNQFNQLVSGEIVGLTDKTIPLDADVTLIESDANANAKRKLSWLNIKSTLKTYFDTLYTIVNLGGVSVISVNTTLTVKASGGDFTTIQAALDSLKSKRINSDVTVTISVDPGLFTHTATILFRHPQGNRINLVGAAPVTTTLTSLVSFVGTTGNYVVTLNVANTAGMTIGDYCIIRGSTGTGEYRAVMGCWEITNIPSGTQIVVKNTYRKTVAPTLTITGGSLDCLKTILKFNGCDGLYPGNATGYIYNLAIVGNGTANTDGINISQRGYNFGNHIIYLGESGASYSLGINGFGRYGIANTSIAHVWVISVAVSNCGNYGLYAYNQAQFAGSGIISSGNGNIGIYATDGAWITAVSSFAIGNSTVGFYANSRAGINAQYSEAVGNIYSGFQANFGSSIDARSTKALNNGYHGYSSGSNSIIYATSSSAVGNGAAINYYGYYAWNDGTIRADSSTGSGNFSGDFRAENFSFIRVTSYTGSPTFSPAVDTIGNGGAIIRRIDATPIKIMESINNVPAGNIIATDVQAAINELDTEKQPSLGFTPEDVSNKDTTISLGTSDTKYPSQKAVKTYVDSLCFTIEDTKTVALNIMLNAFRIAQIGSLTIFGMIKGFVDEYVDESGIDLVNSENQTYNSNEDYYTSLAEVDADTKLLLHLDNNVTDSSILGAKFGDYSANFNGTTSYLSVPTSEDFSFGTGDFTIDFWFNLNSLPTTNTYKMFLGTIDGDGNNGFIIALHNTSDTISLLFQGYTPSGSVVLEVINSPSLNTWHHIALVRNGTNFNLCLNGTSIGTTTSYYSIETSGEALAIGCRNYGGSYLNMIDGYLDEIRISKGIARWTSNFTPPITAYVADSYTKLLLHLENNVTDSEIIPKTVTNNSVTFNFISKTVTNNNVTFSNSIKKFGYSGSFNGSSSYLSVPDSADFDFGSDDFTIDFWVYFNDVTTTRYQALFSKNTIGETLGYTFLWYFDGVDGWIRHMYSPTSGHDVYWMPTVSTWYHVAFVRNGSNLTTYINGTAIDTNDSAPSFTSDSSTFKIGYGTAASAGYWVAAQYFDGYIDEFRVSNIARWTTNFTPPTLSYGAANDILLLSNAQTAFSFPTESRIILFEEDVDSITLNTDLKAYISRDDGTTFSEVTLEDEGNYISGARVVSGSVDISSQPSGTDIKYKIETLNNKTLKLHGTAVSWK